MHAASPHLRKTPSIAILVAVITAALAAALGTVPARAQADVAPTASIPAPTPDAAMPPDQLWRMVHERCAQAAAQQRYPPRPCIEVDDGRDPTHGYAVLKDIKGPTQYLLIPLARISGIESPALLARGATNYFAKAWTARMYVEAALHRPLPREDIALAVNSAHGRTQDQLHIHIDCIRPDVRAALARMRATIGTRWAPLPAPLPPFGHAYRARRVDGASLALNPFQSLAAALPAGDRMGQHTLVVVGAHSASGTPGFILLDGRLDPARDDQASGDELLDHACTVVGGDPR